MKMLLGEMSRSLSAKTTPKKKKQMALLWHGSGGEREKYSIYYLEKEILGN